MKKIWSTGAVALLTAAMLFGQDATPQLDEGGDEAIAAAARGNDEFALKLYRGLRGREGNLFLSPYSVRIALGMTFAGARERTARQMREVLCFHAEGPALAASLSALQERMQGFEELSLAAALWGQDGASFVPAFLEELEESYGAPLRRTDFAGATEQARREINAWTARETERKIEELIQPGDLSSNTELVLATAIHLDAVWPNRFDSASTTLRPFFVTERHGEELRTREIAALTMHQTGRFGQSHAERVSMLELPFSGDALSMVLLLPDEHQGLPALEERLDGKLLQRLFAKLEQTEVAVGLPKFVARTRLELEETLSALGMPDAFDGERADFSGMSTAGQLWIDSVIHEAVVKIDEEGARAAGATAVVMKKRGAVFQANHPFLFLIRERNTGAILFLGRVADPTRS